MLSTSNWVNYGFWEKLKKPASASGRDEPFFVLAPMADVTDGPFRQIVIDCGRPDVLYNEFVSCEGLCSAGRERLLLDLRFKENEHPIVAQFFGTKPEQFYECAKLARELGFDGVDINMGCPDRKVVKQGAGIGLCKDPQRAKQIIEATKEGAGDLPVSVKTRIGLTKPDLEGWIRMILETKITVLTIHGRTMAEMSKVPAHWDLIGEAAKMAHEVGTLAVGNGDVMSLSEGREKAEQYGVDGVMIGRGIFHNPWFFNEKIDHKAVPPKKRLELLLKHSRLFEEFWQGNLPAGRQGKSFDLMKKFFKIYVSEWDGAKDLRAQLMETKTREQVEEIIADYLK
ncbi:MAG: tRNA-dihydrouridine synthase [Patescibacteria group bacterium]